jgi:uncharacterized protein YabE (DUF348 family)
MLKIVALGVSGMLLAAAGGFGAHQLGTKDVTLTIDGVSQEVSASSPTVAGVLISQGVKLGEHDVVTPKPTQGVGAGDEIEVRYGREVTVTVDGVPQTFWTTALTVEEAVGQVNLRAANYNVSTSRSTSIGREGLDFAIDSLFDVTVQAGGKSQKLQTGGTVDDALKDAGVAYDGDDIVTPAATTPITEGLTIKVVKVDEKTTTKKVSIPHTTKTEKSSDLYKGETKVKTEGQAGSKTETWVIRVEDGKPVSQKLKSSVVTKQPVQEIKQVGTKTPPAGSTGSGSGSTSSGGSSNLSPASGNTCKASYYWQGQMTANGEWFNTNDFTAAHKSLPFNTRVKVTNVANGKTTIVRINDRGPYIAGRCLDLSTAAMSAIGGTSAGVITVTWQVA